MTYVFAILGLGVLVLVHELGHMLVARAFGMRVERFSIFFGPPVLRWRGNQTLYQIGVIPLGGYVQIAGLNPQEKLEPDDPGSYQNKSRVAQFATVFAGPLVNYLFAIILVALVMLVWGRPVQSIVVDAVAPASPAARAGMRPGDRLDRIAGRPLRTNEELIARINGSRGRAVAVLVRRGAQTKELEVIPRPSGSGYRIGIQFRPHIEFRAVGVPAALVGAVLYPAAKSLQIASGLKRLVTGRVSAKQVGGPVEIVRQLKMSFESNLATALLFLGLLNIYLGLFNLLPLPALDGGRLVFIVAAMIARRPISQRVENLVHTVGFMLLLILLVLVSFGDVKRLLH